MGRTNKTLQGAFTLIAGTDSERSAVEQFITRNSASASLDSEYSLANSPTSGESGKYSLAKYLEVYKSEYARQAFTVNQLAYLETIIMQLKARSELRDVTVYFNKSKYIYARCPFYRMDRDVKEIRVIVDPIIKYFKNGPKKENLDILNENKEFMDTVYKKITAAMDDEIQESIKNYDILKNNLEYSK